MTPATATAPYPQLFPILPSQQTPISSDPWMFGPYFLLFRSFQFKFLGFFVFPLQCSIKVNCKTTQKYRGLCALLSGKF